MVCVAHRCTRLLRKAQCGECWARVAVAVAVAVEEGAVEGAVAGAALVVVVDVVAAAAAVGGNHDLTILW